MFYEIDVIRIAFVHKLIAHLSRFEETMYVYLYKKCLHDNCLSSEYVNLMHLMNYTSYRQSNDHIYEYIGALYARLYGSYSLFNIGYSL